MVLVDFLCGNFFDGVTLEEKNKINKSYIVFLMSLGSDLVKEIFDTAVEKQLQRAFTEPLTTNLVEEIITKGKFFQSAAKTLTKTFEVVFSFAKGGLNAIDEHKARMEKYTEDIAKHDAFIGYWIFNVMLRLSNAQTYKNYIEVIANRFKTLNYTNSATLFSSVP